MSYDELSHMLLVEKAQKGSQEALSSLISQHRMKMLQWANKIVQNSAKAEDIVQDALIQTLRHIDSLDDPEKFLPWLRSIVRNQSLMTLRSSSVRGESLYDDRSLDEISSHFQHSHLDEPFTYTLGTQLLSEMEAGIDRLGKREQAVIRSHVLEGLSISETAERIGIKSGAVYTALSRARKKLNDFRFEDELDKYISSRRRFGKPDNGGNVNVQYYSYAGAYDTLSSMIMLTASSIGSHQLTLTDVFAATGHAFRFHATDDLGVSGPYAHDWTSSVLSGMENLGLSANVHGGSGYQLKHPDELTDCMEDVFQALEDGIPVISWGLNNAEFGLITGYNDKTKSWTIMDTSTSRKKLPYYKLGRMQHPMDWFVVIPKKNKYSKQRTYPIASMLLQAVKNIHGLDRSDNDFSVSGTATYSKWIDSFNRQQSINPLSVAYNLAVVRESRFHASRFLHTLLDDSRQGRPLPESALSAIVHSTQLFDSIFVKMKTITELFPLPYGADPTAPGPADRAAQLLNRASAEEIEAANALEEAAWILNRKNPT
ncbi:sigma-70 family RNA polymerase sigma factor [Ornithinibacillus sp. L9]|uniref:RNA polymerase sigma factor n=1 Tax=Ornithinibacillus caprae TaxID=2678566 RepID=A0A6N8FR20_9BACI|nr:RNA polymerase sigma factor [Ornithinibacillus caprae]MUK90619.1 sigma-70 family RNA polymerase sigma factor [Ornithinibacillus caprae]